MNYKLILHTIVDLLNNLGEIGGKENVIFDMIFKILDTM